MTTAASRATGELKLELPLDDPRFTPLIKRLATEYWQIVQRKAERSGFPIERAWVTADVDREGVTWFPFTVQSSVTRAEAWAFHRSLNVDVASWDEQLTPVEREVGTRLMLWVVGLDRTRSSADGA